MSYLKKYNKSSGLKNVVSKGEMGLKRAKFDILSLKKGESFKSNTKNNEIGLLIISGEFNLKNKDLTFENVKRANVFSEKPSAVYLPINTEYEIESLNDCTEIAVCSCPAKLQTEPVLIKSEDVKEFNAGVLNWARKAYFIIDERIEAENLFIGETFLPPGNWAFPPHRHDYENYPIEIEMDEIYHYRVNPEDGFGVQLFYTDDKKIDNAYVIRNGDTAIFPEGYHPAGASPVDSIYILWFLAGKKRYFLSKPDEQYKWISRCENLIK